MSSSGKVCALYRACRCVTSAGCTPPRSWPLTVTKPRASSVRPPRAGRPRRGHTTTCPWRTRSRPPVRSVCAPEWRRHRGGRFEGPSRAGSMKRSFGYASGRGRRRRERSWRAPAEVGLEAVALPRREDQEVVRTHRASGFDGESEIRAPTPQRRPRKARGRERGSCRRAVLPGSGVGSSAVPSRDGARGLACRCPATNRFARRSGSEPDVRFGPSARLLGGFHRG